MTTDTAFLATNQMTYFSEMQQEASTTNFFLFWRFITRNLTFAHVRIGLPQSWLVCLCLFVKEIHYFEFPPDFAPQTDQIICFNISIVFSLQVLKRCPRVTISC